MIFIILGVEKFPFDRLVREVDSLVANGTIKDSVLIQLGSCTSEPEHCRWERFLSFGDMCRRMEEADLIIAHAGAGTTLLCLHQGKKPILVPRQKKFGEHVDNHQVIFARKMQEGGLVEVAFETSELTGLIPIGITEKTKSIPIKAQNLKLAGYLDELLDSWEKQ